MSHLVPLSHVLAVGWTVELLAEMNLPIRGEFVDFTEYRARLVEYLHRRTDNAALPPIPTITKRHLRAAETEEEYDALLALGAAQQSRGANHWRDTANELGRKLRAERRYIAKLERHVAGYMLIAGAGWITALAILVNGWAL